MMNAIFLNDIVKPLRKRMCTFEHDFYGYENYESRIIPSIRNSYLHGESNSMVIIGKRGSGKSHLIKSLIKNLSIDDKFSKNMYQVHLNGFLHTDDKNALKSIAAQLQFHLIDEEEDEFTSENFSENFEYILSFLKSGDRDSISLLFVIEEFDLFLQHKNQILIYNLLNCVQSKGTPIFVLGTTTRLDFLGLMEKRVKSRFSHCQIPLIPYAETFDLYVDAAKKLLLIDNNNKCKIKKQWNESVKRFCENTDVLKTLEQNYLISNTISQLKKLLIMPISQLSGSDMNLRAASLQESWKSISMDYKTSILNGLSQLELTFLAVMIHCIAYRDSDINFEIAYKEYQEFSKESYFVTFEKNILRKCLDRLIDLDLVGIKKGANISSNFHTLHCYILHQDLIECTKRKALPSNLQNYINMKLIRK